MYILGISAFYHDSAAALIHNGNIIAAAQEERFTRKKHDFSFPVHSVYSCLDSAGIGIRDLDSIGFYEKPLLKFDRLFTTYISNAPRGLSAYLESIRSFASRKLWIRKIIREELAYGGRIVFPEHHISHAASAFYPSPYDEAAILTIDGVGEWTTTSYGFGQGNDITLLRELRFPHSLGLLYSAFTYYTGFRVNSGEYKLMGLAPYGDPEYTDLIRDHLIDIREDGSFRLDMKYFGYLKGFTMTNDRFHRLFGGSPRTPESLITQKEMDLARSIQEVLEEVLLKMCSTIHRETEMSNLCLAGGVALNCVANGKILKNGPFSNIWIQPAAGDAGGSVGAALTIWHQYLQNKRAVKGYDAMHGSYLGPQFTVGDIEAFLERRGVPYTRLPEDEIIDRTADLLVDGNVVGWFQGRMEFGPRALGNRSIIADARSPQMQKKLNLKIKFRESFRPFAPSILREDLQQYFDLDCDSPYMLLVAGVKKERRIPMREEETRYFGIEKLNVQRSDIPAVTHVDYSARIQTVHRDTNPRYHALLSRFKEKTGYPVIVNTSFNVRGEPIVCTPEDAYRCFMRTEMDYLVLDTVLVDKSAQPELSGDSNWRKEFALD